MRIQLTLAARYLAGRKLRTFLTTLAIVFGVTVIFGLNGVLPTMVKAFTQTLVSSAGEVDISVTGATGGTFEPEIADRVGSVHGIETVSPLYRQALTFPVNKYSITGVSVVGVDPRPALHVRRFPIAEGRFLSPSDDDAVVMTRDTAQALHLQVGSTLRAPGAAGTEELRLVGVLSKPALPGTDEVYVNLPTAQRMFGVRGRINGVEATIEQGADRGQVRSAVRRRLGSDYQIGGVETNSTLFASLKTAQLMFNMFGLFALAIGGFIIFNTFRTAVYERRHDIGMLRSLGASRGTIVGMFLAESLVQGALGTAIGLAGGYLLAAAGLQFMSALASQYFAFKVGAPVFTPGTWAAAVGLGMGITLLAGIWPAVTASRVTPLEALRPTIGEVYERATRRRAGIGGAIVIVSLLGLLPQNAGLSMAAAFAMLVGLVLLAPALVKPVSEAFGALVGLLFVREGRIAQSNLVRQPSRAAITASAVMISLAIVVALLGVVTSIFAAFTGYLDRSLGSDFLILPQSLVLSQGNIGADPKMADALRDVPGMGDVASLRLGFAKKDDVQVQVAGIDPKAYPKVASLDFTEGSEADLRRLGDDRGLIANGIFAAQNGTKAGDVLRMQTPSGAHDYRVVAVGSDYLNAKLSTVYVSQDTLERDFGVTTDIMLLANAAPGAEVSSVMRDAERVLEDFPAFSLHESTTFRESQLEVFNQSMAVYYVLLGLLAFPSLLGLLNTLAINVIARTREIGMLRAVGSTRTQVRRMVLVEALLLSAMGTSLGIIAGIVLGYALTGAANTAGFKTMYAFPYAGILTAIAIGLLFGVIASLVPARHAARLDVVKALRYE